MELEFILDWLRQRWSYRSRSVHFGDGRLLVTTLVGVIAAAISRRME